MDTKGHVKLGDFGLSKVLHKEKTRGICGTVYYMASEVNKVSSMTCFMQSKRSLNNWPGDTSELSIHIQLFQERSP